MPWVGVDCPVDVWELRKWARAVRQMGGTDTAALLERMAVVVSGEAAGANARDRMLEVESRAAAALDRIHADASAKAAAIMGRVMAEGVNISAVMSAAGMDGWADGSAGRKNGGIVRRRRRYPNGQAAAGADGKPLALAEPGAPPLTVESTVARDRRYGESWEGWAGVQLRNAGFKMRHVAKGLGLELGEAWRHVSGWTKHWRREGLCGRSFPGPLPGWEGRLEEARRLAQNIGVKGARVRLNGSGDCGVGGDTEGNGKEGEG